MTKVSRYLADSATNN